ncbi:flagellar biosynthesis protein FlhF [Halomonas sp. M20]|uniref:flagellar biosynthesis protein FlhF n=1 Tax=Halomonas sp. M20 TaxID=2763264 RepID=UPI001D0B43FA|nr:flagellar biosynthesis protein FlhF [Halomonas sp. M20]
MSVKRFVGATSRDAMRQLRAALGNDALILSNRNVAEGVEILAMADEAHGQMVGSPAATQPKPSAMPQAVSRNPMRASASPAPQVTERAHVPSAPSAPQADFAAFSERVLGEMQDLRTLLTGQAQRSADPSRMAAESTLERLQRRLLGAGFGARLVEELLETPPVELVHASDELALAWAKRQLTSRLPILDDEAALLDQGGVFALIGPTGIGKTTTTAKLAARYVMRHGAAGVALVTTDSYRIGAHEQLRIYARLLGVDVHALEADAPLGDLLTRLAHKRLVIIDTVGMSQRDQRLAGQVAMLGDSTGQSQGHQVSRPIRRLLLLNAASHGDTLEEVVETYQRASKAAGAPLFGAILTKVDEAPRLGAVLDIAIRHGLRLHYVSHGQQVPEDLSLADGDTLLDQALNAPGDSSFAAEMPQTSGAASQRKQTQSRKQLTRGLLGQGRALVSTLNTLRNEVAGFALLERAWPLLGYSLEQQQAHLEGLLDGAKRRRHLESVEPAQAMLWAQAKSVSGVDWTMPGLSLNPSGQIQALPWLLHRLPAGEEGRVDWAREQLGIRWQLLPRCPGTATRQRMAESGSTWLATAQAGSQVIVEGRRQRLKELASLADTWTELSCRYRGRDAHLRLSRLVVTLADGTSLTAWFGLLSDPESKRQLAQRYWLAPQEIAGRGDAAADRAAGKGSADHAFAQALMAQLVHDDLPLLTRRAWQRLTDAGEKIDPELRLLVATGLAAVVSRLDQERSDWAMDVRAQLMGSLGKHRGRSTQVLMDALLHLLTARDVFLMLGDAGLGGVGLVDEVAA